MENKRMDCIVCNRKIGTAVDATETGSNMMFFDFKPGENVDLPAGNTLVVDYEKGIIEIGETTHDIVLTLTGLPFVWEWE